LKKPGKNRYQLHHTVPDEHSNEPTVYRLLHNSHPNELLSGTAWLLFHIVPPGRAAMLSSEFFQPSGLLRYKSQPKILVKGKWVKNLSSFGL
jgi:hypothetical protein